MKRTLISLVVGLGITAGVPATAFADDLLQVYQQALANDPVVNQAKAQRDAAFSGITISRANLLPQISGSVGYTTSSSESAQFFESGITMIDSDRDSTSASVNLSMSLYDHANWVGLDRAEKVAEQSDAQLASAMQELIVRVTTAYFDVLRAKDNLEFVKSQKSAIGRQLEQTKQRFEVGLTAITDVHEAQANYDLTEADEIQASNAVELALEALRVISGKYHDKLFELNTEKFSATMPQPASPEEWLDTAEEKNLAMLVNRLAMDIAKEDIASARAGHLPTLDLNASIGKDKSHSTTDLPERTVEGVIVPASTIDNTTPYLDSYSVGVQLNVPIFQGLRVSGQTEQAKFNYISASQDLELTYRQTVQSIRSSFNDVKAAMSTIRALEQAVVSAQSALEATEAGFDVGTRTIVDVLDSTQNLFDARRNLSGARYDFIQAVVSLKQAAGTLTAMDIETINKGLQPQQSEG